MTDKSQVQVAIVGGGPAGAALAIRLAAAGLRPVVLERRGELRWRACGVFSSPLSRRRLLELGLSEEEIGGLARPISALRLITPTGVTCRLKYTSGHALGYDRPALDRLLLDRARAAGADVRLGSVVTSVSLPSSSADAARLAVSRTGSTPAESSFLEARLVVGADGPNSIVARSAGVASNARWLRKAGITFHRADPAAAPESEPMEGEFLLGHGWYAGIAPVPGGRINVGIVVPEGWLRSDERLDLLVARTLDGFPRPRAAWHAAPQLDRTSFALPLAHRTRRAAGNGYVLVGDAAGFLDPLTGEGLHRALVGAELASDAIVEWLRGDPNAVEDYDRHLRARFRNKDVVSWLLQAFLAQPQALEYALRRLDSRRRLRETFTLALTDQRPASSVLDPRFLLRLLRP